MRFRVFAVTVATLSFPFVAFAGGIPFFGPIIPQAYNVCPASWGLLITVINNIISLLITLAIVFVAPLTIAYAGFLYVVNPLNPSGISRAKEILWHTVEGIIFALAGWLIVDAVMAVLYHPSDSSWSTQWASLITGNASDVCLKQQGAVQGQGLNQVPALGSSATGGLNPPTVGPAGSPCDPQAVMNAASAGGYTLSATQANILACIAKPESSCNPSPPPNKYWNNPTGPGGKASTAAGAFQVLLASNSKCYENTTCYDAAGLLPNATTQLNCSTGFNPNGTIKDQAKVNQCLLAANNLNCSASAAACLLQQNGGSFSPWQADVNNAQQTGCITTGG